MKNKTFFLLVALMLGFATVNAQQSSNEKYDYAIVEYFGKSIRISTTEGISEERKVETSANMLNDHKEFLNIIKEMNNKGWQVIGTDYGGTGNMIFYHLQKKKTN
jgi:predicted acetyltransferase